MIPFNYWGVEHLPCTFLKMFPCQEMLKLFTVGTPKLEARIGAKGNLKELHFNPSTKGLDFRSGF